MPDERLFDQRVVERNIASGRITRKQYEEYLSALEDSEENQDVIESEFVDGVLEDEEDEDTEDEEDEEDED